MNNLQRGIYQPLADKVPIYDLAEEDPEEERSRAPLLVVIALVVLAAFAGVVWLAYNQGVERGRQGASLTITAPEGPVRVAPPEAPPAPLSGLTVYNEPVTPEQEARGSTLAPPPPPAAAEPPPIRLSQTVPPPPAAAPTPAPRPAAPPPPPAVRAAAPTPAPPAAPPPPAVRAARPAPPAQTAQAARPPPPAPPPPAPASVPAASGGRAVSGAAVLQLGAFESQELANGAWATFRARYQALNQLAPDVQRADLGAKGIVYRLRAGPFADRMAAVDACTQLKAAGANCFVVAP